MSKKKYETDEERREAKNARVRAQRATWREQGICTKCGREVDDPVKYKRCKSCRDNNAAYMRKTASLRDQKAVDDALMTTCRFYIGSVKDGCSALNFRACNGCRFYQPKGDA